MNCRDTALGPTKRSIDGVARVMPKLKPTRFPLTPDRKVLLQSFFDIFTNFQASKRNQEIVDTAKKIQRGTVAVLAGAAHIMDLKNRFESIGVPVSVLGANDLRDLICSFPSLYGQMDKTNDELKTILAQLKIR